MAALASRAPVDHIERVARRALAVGVAFQTFEWFSAGGLRQAGVMLGSGGIATAHIEEGLRRIRKCLHQTTA
jgi:DNA-binding transcriptional MocR family regulator